MTKTMFARTGSITLTAIAALYLAVPATAAPVEPAVPPSQSDSMPAASKRTTQRICVVNTFTGSRIQRKICKTRANWIAEEGVDPLAAH